AGAGDEIAHGAGYQHFARLGVARDTCADVNGESAHLLSYLFTLAGVQAGAHGDADTRGRVANRAGAADRSRRSVERGEEAVPRGVDFAPAEMRHLTSRDAVVAFQ